MEMLRPVPGSAPTSECALCACAARDAASSVWTRSLGDGDQSSGSGDHRCPPCVDGVDDLGVVDPLQVDRCARRG